MPQESISFSDAQQEAVLGHALSNPALWIQFDELGLSKDWISSETLAGLFVEGQKHRDKYGRPPTAMELGAFVASYHEPKQVDSYHKQIKRCIEAAKHLGIDILQAKLVQWSKSVAIRKYAAEVTRKFNAEDQEATEKAWMDGAAEIQRLDTVSGLMPDRMEASATRLDRESQKRDENAVKMLSYGISFLDDIIVGIPPRDFIMIGARSGVGKTEFAKIIAKNIAVNQRKKVAGFFLEAEPEEIESRIIFNLVMSRWRKSVGSDHVQGNIRYANWLYGKAARQVLAPFEKDAKEEYQDTFQNLKTYYRVRGDFGLQQLDREVNSSKGEADLIILDHLHYVDLDDGENENLEMTRLLQKLRGLTLSTGIPILCISHLNKSAGKTIVPAMGDFHGSSNISKIATTCIMLAPNYNGCEEYTKSLGTYMRIVKSRTAGPEQKFIGVSYYNPETGLYEDKYALGGLNFQESKWIPTEHMPAWALPERLVQGVIETA